MQAGTGRNGDMDLTTHITRIRPVTPTRPLRTIAVVAGPGHQGALHALIDTLDDALVVVDSHRRAYSQIRQLSPDLIVVCVTPDDPDGCQLLSMLALDGGTSGIPVVTHMTPGSPEPDEESVVDGGRDQFVSVN
jgi:CheY-like chemotaxis protein